MAPLSARKYAIEIVELAVREIDVRIAQQRHQIVGVRAHPRVLEVDDVQPPVVQHQVAAVVVAMAEHARLGGELVGDAPAIPRASASRSAASACTSAIALDEMAGEEVELPRQLLDVEGDPIRQVAVARSSAPRRCSSSMSATASPVERRVLDRRRGAEMRLQRDVAEILECDDADRDPNARGSPARAAAPARSSSATFANGSVANSIGPACSASTIDGPSTSRTRKYRRSDASPVSGTTSGSVGSQSAVAQVAVDAFAEVSRA